MKKQLNNVQRLVFCWKASFDAIQKVYGESVVHRVAVFHWYNAFLEGWEYECRSGRRTTKRTCKNIARIADILKEDRQSSCRLKAEWTGIPKTIMQQILHEDLQKWKLCVRFVSDALTAEQKEQCLNHAYDVIETIKSDPNFLDSI